MISSIFKNSYRFNAEEKIRLSSSDISDIPQDPFFESWRQQTVFLAMARYAQILFFSALLLFAFKAIVFWGSAHLSSTQAWPQLIKGFPMIVILLDLIAALLFYMGYQKAGLKITNLSTFFLFWFTLTASFYFYRYQSIYGVEHLAFYTVAAFVVVFVKYMTPQYLIDKEEEKTLQKAIEQSRLESPQEHAHISSIILQNTPKSENCSAV